MSPEFDAALVDSKLRTNCYPKNQSKIFDRLVRMVTWMQLLGLASAIPASQERQKRKGAKSGSSQTHAGDEDYEDDNDDDDGDGDDDYHNKQRRGRVKILPKEEYEDYDLESV